MLTAYFDDSGTHPGSRVVLMGGLYGNDRQWADLEREWRALLDYPGGKWPSLTRFHMHDCVHGEGEFAGHTDGARDRLVARFRNLILAAELHGYAMAVSGADWSRLIRVRHLDRFGDAERFAVTHCLQSAFEWASRETAETEIAFVFDGRPARRDANQRAFSIYQPYSEAEQTTPRPVGISFLNSETSIPLQAAGMFAWESHRWAQQWLAAREPARPRAHVRHFLETGRFSVQCAAASAIQAMIDNAGPGEWKGALDLADAINAPKPKLKAFRRGAAS